MSTAIDFTGFKGDTGLTGVAGLSIHSGVGTPETVVGSNNGDLYLDTTGTETDAGRIFKRIDVGDTETWVLQYDLSGAKGDTPVFGMPTASTVAVGGTPTVTQTGTDLAPVLDFGLVTGATGATGVAAAGTVITTTITREAAFIRYTLVDNPGTIPTNFPREIVTIFSNAVAYNKFNSDTPPAGDPRGQLIFQLGNTPDVTQSGFVDAGGSDPQKYQIWSILNAASTTGAVIAADIADRINADGVAFERNSTTGNGETWDIDVTAVGNTIEIRDKDGDNIAGTFTVRDGLTWTSENVGEISAGDVLVADQSFTTGSFIVYESVFYGCILGYSSNDNNVAPDANGTNWAALN